MLAERPQVEEANPLSRRAAVTTELYARRRLAEHDGNQPAAAALCAHHRVKPSRADEPRLHAIGAGIAPEQPVVSVEDTAIERNRADAEIVAMLGKLGEQGAGENGKILRGRMMRQIGQAIRVGEIAVGHAQPLSRAIYHAGETFDGASNPFGKRDRDVICRFDEHHLQGVVDGQHRPGMKAHLRGGLACRIRAYHDQRIGREPPRPHFIEHDIGGHQFGE